MQKQSKQQEKNFTDGEIRNQYRQLVLNFILQKTFYRRENTWGEFCPDVPATPTILSPRWGKLPWWFNLGQRVCPALSSGMGVAVM